MVVESISLLALLTLASGVLSLLCLFILHFTSPEFKPSWRMISEYALGKHKWLITCFFIFWSISSFSLSVLLWPTVSGTWATAGVVLLFISGIGELTGGLFDVKHKLHGAAFGLGVPALPAAALMLSYNMKEDSTLILLAHSTWISVVLMAVSMILLISGFKKAGLPMGPDVTPPEKLPAGVIGISGYANRLLVLCYVGWLMVMAYAYLSF
jgi:hypothetical protein